MKTHRLKELRIAACMLSILILTSAFTNTATAQLYNLTPDDLKAYTASNPYGRYPDGRPMIPDAVLDSVKKLQVQVIEAHGVLRGSLPENQQNSTLYEAGWKMLDPNKKIYGRAVTVQFMPSRPDLVAGMRSLAEKNKTPIVSKSNTIDILQKNDVAVIDLYGKVEGGLPYVGDKLGYYISQTTGTGFIVDGGIYYLETMAAHGVQAFYRGGQLASTGSAAVTGVNVPVQIGGITIMPGDLIIGDQEGIIAVPPHVVSRLISAVTGFRRRDEWIRAAFALGRYKSGEIYGSPKDPVLLKLFNDYKATGDKKFLPK